ncbi:MAG: ABC transporter ATP-binding protein [Clostridiales Family XIII bacterium]|jgi:ABC-type Fe3+/spermidine/putrescine transport system ATPase subunit|nr:ABC transporter ATP-binding protein [Clostridiales Family XIII bacterium]
MGCLELTDIVKTYRGAAEPALRGLNLSVEEGEILAILGVSGCGKTTALKVVSGLERQDSGHVALGGQEMDGLAPEKRPIAMVFQKSLLFRNMTVAENINFAPRIGRGMGKKLLAQKTGEMLELMQLGGLGGKRATEISGGQEQRVSLGRALMTEPKLLLLDEPLSALDPGLKLALEAHIQEVNRKLGTTMLYVTHDQKEATRIASRIALMQNGRIVQCAKPQDFYAKPATKQVAEFFGWENFIPARKRGALVSSPLGEFAIEGAAAGDGGVLLCVRPEAATEIGRGRIKAVVRSVLPQGIETVYETDCSGARLKLSLNMRHSFSAGEEIRFDIDPQMVWCVAADRVVI